jgi:hypothetical protein
MHGVRVSIESHSGMEFLEFLKWILEHRKEFTMSQVQFSATFNVTGGTSPNPLVVTPTSNTFNLVVGTPADGTAVAVVSAGTPPYTYSLDAASGPLPTGVTFAEDSNGNITLAGTPTVAGTSTTPVLLDINDSAGGSAQLKASVRAIR